jgi:hypothetical protein
MNSLRDGINMFRDGINMFALKQKARKRRTS